MKRGLFTLLLVGAGMLAFDKTGKGWVRAPREAEKFGPAEKSDAMERTTAAATRRYMLYVLLPVWFVPGALDWIWHRGRRMDKADGSRGSILHALMVVEAGLPVLMGLFMEINAGVFALMSGAAALQEATTFWYVRHAASCRKLTPRERRVYSLLEMVPLAAVTFAACLYPEEFTSLFGDRSNDRSNPCQFAIRWSRPLLPAGWAAGVLSAVALFIGIPCAVEIARCGKAGRKH